jgi:cyclic pyranopterin phosphate synthase
MRRGDYLWRNLGQSPAMPIEWYIKAIAIVKSTYPESNFIVFSDDIEYAKLNFGNLYKFHFFYENEIIDFIEMTKDRNIQIRFIEFMPFDGNQWNKEKLVSYSEIMEQVEYFYSNENVKRIQDKPNDTAKNHKIESYKGSFSVISSVTNPFCSTCNRIRLTADGKLKNCLFSNSETSLLDTLRAGESIEPLIFQNIKSKHAMRGGMDDDAKFQDPKLFSQNRSMIKIGG